MEFTQKRKWIKNWYYIIQYFNFSQVYSARYTTITALAGLSYSTEILMFQSLSVFQITETVGPLILVSSARNSRNRAEPGPVFSKWDSLCVTTLQYLNGAAYCLSYCQGKETELALQNIDFK